MDKRKGYVLLFDIHVVCRKYLEMPNGQTEAVNLMMTDNIIV
jgi:hypothetical protein